MQWESRQLSYKPHLPSSQFDQKQWKSRYNSHIPTLNLVWLTFINAGLRLTGSMQWESRQLSYKSLLTLILVLKTRGLRNVNRHVSLAFQSLYGYQHSLRENLHSLSSVYRLNSTGTQVDTARSGASAIFTDVPDFFSSLIYMLCIEWAKIRWEPTFWSDRRHGNSWATGKRKVSNMLVQPLQVEHNWAF